MGRNGSAAPAPAVARNGSGSDGHVSGSSGTLAAPGGDRGRAFHTPIIRGRKKSRTDDDNDGGFSVSNVMGMMMMQQRSEQSSREADRMAREVELSLRQEEIAMRCKEMTSQLQIQREESRAHQQMTNVMLMAMVQTSPGPISSRGRRTAEPMNTRRWKSAETISRSQSAGQFSRTVRTTSKYMCTTKTTTTTTSIWTTVAPLLILT